MPKNNLEINIPNSINVSEIKQCFNIFPTNNKVKNFQISIVNKEKTEVYFLITTDKNINQNNIFYTTYLTNAFCEIPLIKGEILVFCVKSTIPNQITIFITEEFEDLSKPNIVTDVIVSLNDNSNNYKIFFLSILLVIIMGYFFFQKKKIFT